MTTGFEKAKRAVWQCGSLLLVALLLMLASYRNWAGQTDESPDIPHSFICRREGCNGKKCPEARNQKTYTRPNRNSVFHGAAPTQYHSTTFDFRSVTVVTRRGC